MNRYTELSKPPGHRSDLVKAEAREYYTALLRPLFEGRRFIHAGGLAVGLGREARHPGSTRGRQAAHSGLR